MSTTSTADLSLAPGEGTTLASVTANFANVTAGNSSAGTVLLSNPALQ